MIFNKTHVAATHAEMVEWMRWFVATYVTPRERVQAEALLMLFGNSGAFFAKLRNGELKMAKCLACGGSGVAGIVGADGRAKACVPCHGTGSIVTEVQIGREASAGQQEVLPADGRPVQDVAGQEGDGAGQGVPPDNTVPFPRREGGGPGGPEGPLFPPPLA